MFFVFDYLFFLSLAGGGGSFFFFCFFFLGGGGVGRHTSGSLMLGKAHFASQTRTRPGRNWASEGAPKP